MARIKPWRHTVSDGRGRREVYIDGQGVTGCVYADERRGVVLVNLYPIQLTRSGFRVRLVRMKGDVKVVFIGDI